MRKSAGGTPLRNRDTVSENCAYDLIVRTKRCKPQLLEADCCVRCFDSRCLFIKDTDDISLLKFALQERRFSSTSLGETPVRVMCG